MKKDFRTLVLQKKKKLHDEYVEILLKELAKRGVDTPIPEKETHFDTDGIGGVHTSFDVDQFINEDGNVLEGLPLFLRSMAVVTDERKSIKRADVVITTTFAYKIGDEATYQMKESDRKQLRKIVTDV